MQSKLIGTVVLETAAKYLMMVANGKQNEIVLHRDGTLTYAVDGKWQGMPAANGPAKYEECKVSAQTRGVEVVEVLC